MQWCALVTQPRPQHQFASTHHRRPASDYCTQACALPRCTRTCSIEEQLGRDELPSPRCSRARAALAARLENACAKQARTHGIITDSLACVESCACVEATASRPTRFKASAERLTTAQTPSSLWVSSIKSDVCLVSAGLESFLELCTRRWRCPCDFFIRVDAREPSDAWRQCKVDHRTTSVDMCGERWRAYEDIVSRAGKRRCECDQLRRRRL